MAKVLAPDSSQGRVFGRAPARQPASPRRRHVQAATGHGRRQQGESPKSSDDLSPRTAILGVITSLLMRTADRDVPENPGRNQ
jgi:hypothetical protein